MTVGVSTAIVVLAIGGTLGVVAGYFNCVDRIVMRLANVLGIMPRMHRPMPRNVEGRIALG
ncbi:hypothetical protein [Rhizobium sp. FKY42]|uniref:hypothetical protein n=1 Tax=Rhizobium sp. FKY42 TaxID=2562310 RepID=UPI0010C0A14E|nr:hypothetical protein [Rhizobium sp. FKY42]